MLQKIITHHQSPLMQVKKVFIFSDMSTNSIHVYQFEASDSVFHYGNFEWKLNLFYNNWWVSNSENWFIGKICSEQKLNAIYQHHNKKKHLLEFMYILSTDLTVEWSYLYITGTSGTCTYKTSTYTVYIYFLPYNLHVPIWPDLELSLFP